MISPLRLGFAGFLMLILSFTGLVQSSAVSSEDKAEIPEVTAHVIEFETLYSLLFQ